MRACLEFRVYDLHPWVSVSSVSLGIRNLGLGLVGAKE